MTSAEKRPSLSILDLAPICEGSDAATALAHSRDLAQHAENWGYRRFWLAEHHNLGGVASAATSIAIAHVAAGTSTIRVGAGGIMLPNHAPLIVAEQFGTLASLYPNRIDLGVGRAPGTDAITSRALRRTGDGDTFPDDVAELLSYLDDPEPGQYVRAIPGEGTHVPVWILGSSLFGAQLAAFLGLPFAFASHFAPAALMQALDIYRAKFKPSKHLDQPRVMVGVNAFAADTVAEARLMFTSAQQAFVNLRRGRPGRLPPPREGFDATLSPSERAMIEETLSMTAIGTVDDVRARLRAIAERTKADELIVASMMFHHAQRLRSYELTAQAFT
jgi:luciferase family oxidoreductase group 1